MVLLIAGFNFTLLLSATFFHRCYSPSLQTIHWYQQIYKIFRLFIFLALLLLLLNIIRNLRQQRDPVNRRKVMWLF